MIPASVKDKGTGTGAEAYQRLEQRGRGCRRGKAPEWKAAVWQCKGTRYRHIRQMLISGQQTTTSTPPPPCASTATVPKNQAKQRFNAHPVPCLDKTVPACGTHYGKHT